MHRFTSRLATAVLATALSLASATAAFAQEHGGAPAAGGESVSERVVWTIVAVLGGGLLLSVFYLLKRRVGGFPKNPQWVAPITIMPSKDLPGDRDPHEAHEGDAHGHAPAAAHH